MEIFNLIMQKLPQDKQMVFLMQYNGVKKDPQLAVILSALLGGVGIHRFYMGEVGIGVIYLLFSWTFIPLILGVLEAFTISNKIKEYNDTKAREIATSMGFSNLI